MNPYVPLLFTLFVGVLGGFFDKTHKPDAKVVVEAELQPEARDGSGAFQLPRLTRAGVLLLLLYLGSFIFSLYTTHLNGKDIAKKAEDAKRETASATERGDTLQRELVATEGKLAQLRDENLAQFKGVGDHLAKTASAVAIQLDGSATKLTDTIDRSGSELDRTTRGSSTLLDSFWLSVYEVSQRSDFTLWGGRSTQGLLTDEERKRFSERLAELSTLACGAPAPMTIETTIPLSDEPMISLIATTSKIEGQCHTVARLDAGVLKRKLTATSQSWTSGYRPENPRTLWRSNTTFANGDLRPILDHYRVSVIAFRPHRSAIMRVAGEKLEDMSKLRLYAAAHLPVALGFYLRPSLDDGRVPLDEFEAERNYLLTSMLANFVNSSIGTAITFYYRPQDIRPEWSHREKARPGVAATEIIIENPYRVNSPQLDTP